MSCHKAKLGLTWATLPRIRGAILAEADTFTRRKSPADFICGGGVGRPPPTSIDRIPRGLSTLGPADGRAERRREQGVGATWRHATRQRAASVSTPATPAEPGPLFPLSPAPAPPGCDEVSTAYPGKTETNPQHRIFSSSRLQTSR